MAQNGARGWGTPVQDLLHQPRGRGPRLMGSKSGAAQQQVVAWQQPLALALLCLQRMRVRSPKASGST